mgnify:CR=1 FL=1
MRVGTRQADGRTVPRLLSLLASLALILAIGMGSLAHATEGPGCIEAPAVEISTHSPGDFDHVAADSDKPYAHHHDACHNHQIGVPTLGQVEPQPVNLAQDFTPHPGAHLAPAPDDPALRPPQA